MRLFIVVVALFLAACATMPAALEPTAELARTHGFVHISVPSENLDTATMTLRSRKDSRAFALRHTARDPRGIGAWVPAGEYDIVEVTPLIRTSYAPLVVEAGRLTDAGGLFTFNLGNYESVTVPLHRPELDEEAAAAAARNGDYLTNREPIVWDPKDLPPRRTIGPKDAVLGGGLVELAVRQVEYELNRQGANAKLADAKTIDALWAAGAPMARPVNPAVRGAQGELYYPAALGRIRVRSGTGQWSSIDTGTTYAVQAVFVDGDRIVAATRNGGILVRDEASGPFRRVAHLPDGYTAASVARFDGRWFVCGLHLIIDGRPWAERVTLFEAARADFGDLAPVRTITMQDHNFSPVFEFASRGDHLYFNAGEDVFALDTGAREWSSIKPDHPTRSLFVTPDGTLLTAFHGRGIFSKLSTSDDDGRTWKSRPIPPTITTTIGFVDDGHANATRMNTGAFRSTLEVMRFDATSNAWKVESQGPPGGCNYALTDDTRARFFCVSPLGNISRFEAGADAKPEYVLD